jgi:hypothetical protein
LVYGHRHAGGAGRWRLELFVIRQGRIGGKVVFVRSRLGRSRAGRGRRRGLGDIRGINFRRGVFQREIEVVDKKPDVAVGERQLELLDQLALDYGKGVAGGDP